MIQIFVSYSHNDSQYVEGRASLLKYLSGMEANRSAHFWFDRMISTGAVWDDEIRRQIRASRIALVLISQWFLDSAYIRAVEVASFMEKRRREGMIIFPIILAPCEWQKHEWLAGTQCLPRDGKTVSQHFARREKREALFYQIRQDLTSIVEEIERRAGRAQDGCGHMGVTSKRKAQSSRPLIGVSQGRGAFTAVEHLLEAGDRVSAINAILRGGSFAEAGREEQLDVIVICQKLGFLKDCRAFLARAYATATERSMSLDVQGRLKLVELKLLSQEGRFEDVLMLYPTVVSLLRRSGQSGRAPQAHHRAGIAHAVLNQPRPASSCFRKSIDVAERHGNPHAALTGRLMLAIAQAFGHVPRGRNDPLAVIAASQEAYLAEPISHVLWQSNRLKSAVQALFAESAVLLEGRLSYGPGWIRVTTAHLLARQAGSSPAAEGYSELLSLTRIARVRDVVRSAMRTEDSNRHAFQQQYLTNATYLTDCQKCVSILSPPNPETWRAVRKFLTDLDARYGGLMSEASQ